MASGIFSFLWKMLIFTIRMLVGSLVYFSVMVYERAQKHLGIPEISHRIKKDTGPLFSRLIHVFSNIKKSPRRKLINFLNTIPNENQPDRDKILYMIVFEIDSRELTSLVKEGKLKTLIKRFDDLTLEGIDFSPLIESEFHRLKKTSRLSSSLKEGRNQAGKKFYAGEACTSLELSPESKDSHLRNQLPGKEEEEGKNSKNLNTISLPFIVITNTSGSSFTQEGLPIEEGTFSLQRKKAIKKALL